jgi:phospholipid-binding lipoprotein MlaA
MLPILGMGTVRDWGGWTVDLQGDLLWYNDEHDVKLGLIFWRFTSDRAALLPAEAALEASFDEYAFIRRAYLQRRRYEVYDGAPPEEDFGLDLELEPDLDPALDPVPDPELDLDE